MRFVQQTTYGDWEFFLGHLNDIYYCIVRKNGVKKAQTLLRFADDDSACRWHSEFVHECLVQIECGAM